MRRLGTLGIFVLSLIAYVVGGTSVAVAQQKMVQTFRTHVSADEEVWDIAPSTLAESVVTRLGHELRWAGLDCSHLVHDIYERAGFAYDYATSRDLYDGVDAFRRVRVPLPGDIIVWRGHVGLVIGPENHRFLSALRSGIKVSAYDTNYWKMRGHPRFYRYARQGNGAPDWTQAALSGPSSDGVE